MPALSVGTQSNPRQGALEGTDRKEHRHSKLESRNRGKAPPMECLHRTRDRAIAQSEPDPTSALPSEHRIAGSLAANRSARDTNPDFATQRKSEAPRGMEANRSNPNKHDEPTSLGLLADSVLIQPHADAATQTDRSMSTTSLL